jgi:peptidoglycan hydrolase CwlO-like protein
MLSISIKKLSKQRKLQLAIAAGISVVLLGGILVLALTRNHSTSAKKAATTSKSKTDSTKKAAASTEDVQNDLNSINNKTSTLNSEVDATTSGINDQQANLTY